MKIKQLSLFLENKPGQVKAPCRVLAEAGVNILTMTLADTEQFGILRLVVQDWQKARAALEKAGCVVNVTEVLALEVADRPGGLMEILDVLERNKLAIEYMYAFTRAPQNRQAVLVFRFEDPDQAIKVLQQAGINPVSSVELVDRVK
jgi:hypothetical protein